MVSEAVTRKLVKLRAVSATPESVPESALCERCGSRWLEEMHHRKYRSQGGQWSPSNCVGLCRDCHQAATVNPAWAMALGLSVPSWAVSGEIPVEVWYARHRVILDDSGGIEEQDGR